MRSLGFFVILFTSWCGAQNGRGPPSLLQDHSHGWDIRLAVPGEPGSDYPVLGTIPRTGFSCSGKKPGYYADVEAGCQVFRVCTIGSTYGFQSFLCPNGTLFNQEVFVCDWWMNVKCSNYERLVSNNDRFGNLRLGPQLMKDIKKMLTHTMRNPYDKSVMKSNLIVMQDYKPPVGQLFPNGALIAGPDRAPNNVYVPSKQIMPPNFRSNDIAFAASTPDTRYIPAAFTRPLNGDAEVFQRQMQQNAQYVQDINLQPNQNSQNKHLILNGRLGNNFKQARPNQNFNQVNAQYTQKLTQGPNNSQRVKLNRQRAQFTEVKKPLLNDGKQNDFGPYTKQQYNREKQQYTYKTPTPTLPSSLNILNDKELKQNLALVFSILADSLNAAKKYSNKIKQDILTSTSTQAPQLQNLNNEDLTEITNRISQLTASQYSDQNAQNIRVQSTNPSQTNQIKGNDAIRQSAQYNNAPATQTPKSLYSAQYQRDNSLTENFFDNDQNQIYSGQLYQLPVPQVTSQIYNRPQSANIIQSSSKQKTAQIGSSPQNSNLNNPGNRTNFAKQSSAEVEIVQSQTLPLNAAKLQLAPSNEPEPFYSQENLHNLLNTDNEISAQLQDKIIGVIPHPIEDNKILTYEKDQSYYLYTKFDENGRNIAPTGDLKPRKRPNVITFQFVPSLSYQLEDEKEQQKLLNTFQIDEFGAPRDVTKANLVEDSNQRGTIVSNIDYSVEHPPSRQINGLTSVNVLYNGPSSYSAPQGSVGSLSRDNLNSRLERLDEKSTDGYPKTTPSRRFVF